MDTIFAKVAGLDVHQKFITVGIRCRLETGKLFAEVRTFGTMTRDLMALADYLEALGVTLHFPRKHRTCGDWARRRERRFFDADR